MATNIKEYRTSPGHFLYKPSHLCEEALAVLQRLKKAEGVDMVTRVTAEVIAAAALADFARTRKVRERRGGGWHVCVNRLRGGRCRPQGDCPNIPAGDHVSEWCRGRETVAIVSQPYGLSRKDLKETMAFAAEYKLDVDIDTWPSWHFPGHVLTVVFTRAGGSLGPTP